jgi:hypothetical protein
MNHTHTHPVHASTAHTMTALATLVDDAQRQAAAVARAYALRMTRVYSLEHPSRVCRLQAAGGYCTLHVSTRNALVPFGEYIFGMVGGNRFQITDTRTVQGPGFLNSLQRWGQALHNRHDDWFGPLDITFIAGVEQ